MPQVGLVCLAGRHNPLEALRKDELHLGKLKGAGGSGVAGSKTSPHSSRGVARPCPRTGGLQREGGSVCSGSRDIGNATP